MKCEIIRDLLPSYIDGLTNEVSSRMVEEHLEGCDECREIYEDMKKDIAIEKYVNLSKEEAKKEIRPFKKLKKNAIIIIILLVVLCDLAFNSFVNDGIQARAQDIDITYEKHGDLVIISFKPLRDNIYLNVRNGVKEAHFWEQGYDEAKIKPEEIVDRIRVLEYNENLFNPAPSAKNNVSYVLIDENTIYSVDNEQFIEFTDDQVLRISGIQSIKIKDLYTGEGFEEIKVKP